MHTPRLSSQRRSLTRLTGALAAAAVLTLTFGGLTLTFGGTAWAAPDDDAFARLLGSNPGLNAAELEESMHEAAAATGLTYDQAITTALEEAERHARSAGSVSTMGSSNPDCTMVAVGKARYKGDIFYSTASTYGVSHGHAGIYSEKEWITEARGEDQRSGEFYYDGRKYCRNIQKMEVDTSVANRNKAADYALRSLTGKPYSSNFAWNKGGDISDLNCSELVFKAYKRSVNIDLDGDGGLGVYPSDIVESSKTITYEIIK